MEELQMKGTDLILEFEGLNISYDDLGIGEVPIIFIHGFPFDKSMWQPQMDFLVKTNRVIAYDIRGFGQSTAGREKESIKVFAEDLIKFMDALEIPKAIVCGLSMGGYILLNAVFSDPDRFEAIVLSDTQCIGDSAEVKEKRFTSISQVMAGGIEEFTQSFVERIFCNLTKNTKSDIVDTIKTSMLATSPQTITRGLRALAQRKGMCASLNKIAIPTLILCGMEDLVTPPAQSEYLHQQIENSSMHLIAQAGHLSNLEQPDEFNNLIFNFISDCSKIRKVDLLTN